jgi:hypothetical protein
MHFDISPSPARSPIRLSPRWAIVVLGAFLDGELVYMIDKHAGDA